METGRNRIGNGRRGAKSFPGIHDEVQLKTAILDQETVDAASVLYRKWNPGFGTDVNDAVLAATVMKSGGIIYCLNKKHYPMPEIMVRKAWSIFPLPPNWLAILILIV